MYRSAKLLFLYFRQNIKWPSSTQSGKLDESCEWNQILVNDVLPRALCSMMTSATHMNIPSNAVAKLFPNVSRWWDWRGLLKPFYNLIKDQNVLFSEEDGGKWVTPAEALVLDDVTPTAAATVVRKVLLNSRLPSNLVSPASFVRNFLWEVRRTDIQAVCYNQFESRLHE